MRTTGLSSLEMAPSGPQHEATSAAAGMERSRTPAAAPRSSDFEPAASPPAQAQPNPFVSNGVGPHCGPATSDTKGGAPGDGACCALRARRARFSKKLVKTSGEIHKDIHTNARAQRMHSGIDGSDGWRIYTPPIFCDDLGSFDPRVDTQRSCRLFSSPRSDLLVAQQRGADAAGVHGRTRIPTSRRGRTRTYFWLNNTWQMLGYTSLGSRPRLTARTSCSCRCWRAGAHYNRGR